MPSQSNIFAYEIYYSDEVLGVTTIGEIRHRTTYRMFWPTPNLCVRVVFLTLVLPLLIDRKSVV